MGFLKSLFGPSKEEIWGQIANDIGGRFDDGGFFGKDTLKYQHGEWELHLDTFTRSSGTGNNRSSTTYTRMRAPFVNKDNLYFKIYEEGFLSPLGKFLGMQDIEVGDNYFDENFVIKGNSESQVKSLFADEEIKRLIHGQPRIQLEIKDDEGWFGSSFPDGVDELYFEVRGVMKDTAVLKDLFELFSRVLDRLVEIDSAYETSARVSL
ncbi:MAG: hypothetical protein NE334_13450 [Lentisphaeraceae bacterium]|nr:hypothetical protein [Lentisphaeraceae bacterium]